jgi:hypothetical protein
VHCQHHDGSQQNEYCVRARFECIHCVLPKIDCIGLAKIVPLFSALILHDAHGAEHKKRPIAGRIGLKCTIMAPWVYLRNTAKPPT